MQLPRLLSIANATLNNNDGGINRALYNLLDFYDPAKLKLYTDHHLLKQRPTSSPFGNNVVSFNSYYLHYFNNILGKILNLYIILTLLSNLIRKLNKGGYIVLLTGDIQSITQD